MKEHDIYMDLIGNREGGTTGSHECEISWQDSWGPSLMLVIKEFVFSKVE